MTRRTIRSFWRDQSGAVAATYTIALTGLVAVAGVGFDYARMAGLDSELQNGADQAALAGATQLDKQFGACARAGNAAVAMLRNITLLANDGAAAGNEVRVSGGATVALGEDECDSFPGITFHATEGGPAVSTDEAANFIQVAVDARTANYAFTPIVGLTSATMNARALAGVGNAVCKAPPVMICNPGENAGDPNFDVANYIGKGIKLVSVGNSGGAWAPGNFGYLDTEGYSNGAPGLREALGWQTLPGDCLQYTGVDTKPGATVTATDALNTRFDVYESNVSCPNGGACPASINSVKDFKRPANANGGQACRTHNQGWQLPSGYYGETAVSPTIPLPASVIPTAMGHPRDMCHLAASGGCTGPIGNGVWDRDAYFRTNYVRANGTRWTDWQSNTGLPSNATRYDVYKWELDHRGQLKDGVTVLGSLPNPASGNTLRSHGQPVCSASEGHGAPVVPGGPNADRRRIPVAVVNCTAQGVNGNSTNVQVAQWIDVFLVEPSFSRARTHAGDVYIEVIGASTLGGGGGGSSPAQTIVKSKPYLIQ
jgi:Flp pilus assembly protein TadG